MEEPYFLAEHRKEDLDCYFEKGDLSNVTSRELKRVMRFDPDDLVYAGKMDFLYTRQGIARLVGEGVKISTLVNCVTKQI